MAVRARLTPPRPQRETWPWHHAKHTAMSAAILAGGDRRFEAENYLAGGYGIRLALESRKAGWARLERMARVWQPNRLKGTLVSPDYGTPFLAATQVFDLRPVPRKYLSLERTSNAVGRTVQRGTILVTCSGSVGRATMSHEAHERVLISHDLLRVEPRSDKAWGWIYAFLRSPQGRAMMTAAQYGHIIKHLEISHMNALPIPVLRDELLKHFSKKTQEVLNRRGRAFEIACEAERLFENSFPSAKAFTGGQLGFSVASEEVFGFRRRLEASVFVPSVESNIAAFHRHAVEVVSLQSVVQRVFVPGRFKHVYGDGGTPYLDSADLLEVNPDVKKHVLSLSPEEQKEYHVDPGWVLIPCSGQVHGNIGHSVLSTEWHSGKILSNHILRVRPGDDVRAGYLQCALGHPRLGRPQVVRYAFGSSVPEIAAEDIKTLFLPRLEQATEDAIADLMEESAEARDSADALEQAIAIEAEELIDRFLAGDHTDFVVI